LQKTGTPTLAKVYFAADKKRIEMQDASGDDKIIVKLAQPTASKRGAHLQTGGRGDTIIMNFAAHTATILFPREKNYAEGWSIWCERAWSSKSKKRSWLPVTAILCQEQ
jgi:hypothetical protein